MNTIPCLPCSGQTVQTIAIPGPIGYMAVYGGTANPNGNVVATGPAIYIQDDGAGNFVAVFYKLSGSSGNTGWN